MKKKLKTVMKGECSGCQLEREVEGYDMSHTGQSRSMHLCASCADVLGLQELRKSSHGSLLLKVNSKLDLLLGKR